MRFSIYSNRLNRKAFSLLEILVVLVVVGVLIFLGFFAMKSVRESSNQAKCLQNLKQLGVAFLSYAVDHDGFLPRGDIPRSGGGGGEFTHWTYVVDSYLDVDFEQVAKDRMAFRKTPFSCPAEEGTSVYNYAQNRQLNERLYGDAARIKVMDVVAPSRWVMISDGYYDRTIFTDTRAKMLSMTRITRRHDGAPNFLYADGHAAPYHGEIYGIADAEGRNDPEIRALWEYQYRPQ